MLLCGDKADGLLCGTFGAYANHLRYVEEVIGLAEGAHSFAAMSLLQLPRHTLSSSAIPTSISIRRRRRSP